MNTAGHRKFIGISIATLLVSSPLATEAQSQVLRTADLPVTYIVDDKELKQAASGTELTFELFEESACTNLVHATVLPIDDVITVRLKRFRPSGGTKPPRTAELRATIPDVVAMGNLYLEVSGIGVSAVGTACQPQAAQLAVPPTCNDQVRNQGESDVDCGGTNCVPCPAGKRCAVGSDCRGEECVDGLCVANCFDSVKNQDETGTDCGGSICEARCVWDGCLSASDCAQIYQTPTLCLYNWCTVTTSTTSTMIVTTTTVTTTTVSGG